MKPKTKRIISGSLLATVALAVLAGGAYYTWLTTPPAMPTTVEEAAAVLRSPRYLRLPQTRRFDYVQRASELFDKAPPEQKKEMMQLARKDTQSRDAMQQAMQDRMYLEVRNYVLADDFDRRTIIDRVVAMQEMAIGQQRKRQAQAKPPTPEQQKARDERRQQRQQEFMSQLQKQYEQGNPQFQAYFGEFLKAVMTRREQMGLEAVPEPPRR